MIDLKPGDKGFSLFFKGREILRHEESGPFIRLAQGRASFKTREKNSSSFKIRDRIIRRINVSSWETGETSPERVSVKFGGLIDAVFSVSEGRLVVSFNCPDASVNRFFINIRAHKGEHIYGCGEQFSRLDLKGQRVPLWVEEQGVGRGRDLITLLAEIHSGAGGNAFTTYYPQPTFVSSENYSCHVETAAYTVVDFRKPGMTLIETWALPRLFIDVQDSAPLLLGRMSALLGRQPDLPEWCYGGVWLGAQGGTSTVDLKLNDALNSGVKVAALWCQDWEGIRITSFGKQLMWNWKYDKELYSGLPAYIKALDSKNIKFLGYINPMLAQEGDLYREALAKGYLVKKKDGSVADIYITTFPVGLLDLTNPDAVSWYKSVIKEHLIGTGLGGWMADFGEALPADAKLFSGEDASLVHNEYPVRWAKLNRDALLESGRSGDIVYFMRAGYSGTSANAPLIWAGDQLVNWSEDDGLPTVIPAGISLGFCGIGYYHSDVGGYTTLVWLKRTKELFMRWAEHCAFTQVMRTHESNRPGTNWQFNSDAETLAHFSKMSRVYAALRPYHMLAAEEYREYGLPPMRHPFIHYEGDEILHSLKYQYLYGRDLMAAPAVKKGAKTVKLYLPDDEWIHLWTGRTYGKGWHRTAAPFGEPPVFYRKSSRFAGLFEEVGKIQDFSAEPGKGFGNE